LLRLTQLPLSLAGVDLSRAAFAVPSVTQKKNTIPTNAHSSKMSLKLIKVGGQGGGGQLGGSAIAGASSKPHTVASPASMPMAISSPPAQAPGLASTPAGLTAVVIHSIESDKSSTNSFRS
jgi:hypothetical protein